MTDSAYPETQLYPRPPRRRRHNGQGQIAPATRAFARAADDLVDQARAVVALAGPDSGAIPPLELLREIGRLKASLELVDRAFRQLERSR